MQVPFTNRRCGILQAQCAQEASLHIGLVINHLKFVPFRKNGAVVHAGACILKYALGLEVIVHLRCLRELKSTWKRPLLYSANLAELPLLLLVSYAREHMQQGSGEKVTLSSEHFREDLRSYQLGLG